MQKLVNTLVFFYNTDISKYKNKPIKSNELYYINILFLIYLPQAQHVNHKNNLSGTKKGLSSFGIRFNTHKDCIRKRKKKKIEKKLSGFERSQCAIYMSHREDIFIVS